MKPAEARLRRALDEADPRIRLYLLHGPDEAAARALAQRLHVALGAEAERVDLVSSALKADPARLTDEAAAFAMFGGRRWIRVDPAGDDAADAFAALLQAPSVGNPVVAIGPTLRKDSRLVKLATASDAALVHACYLPEGRDADTLAVELGREVGLQLTPDIARRVAASTGADRALMSRELEKLALYLDASPDRPQSLPAEALDAIGTVGEDGDLARLGSAVFAGDVAGTESEWSRLNGEGVASVLVVRALARRALQLTQLRAQVASGDSVDRVMETAGKSIFWKDRPHVARALGRWEPATLATATVRLAEVERQIKTSGYPGNAAVGEAIIAIARHAARRA